jgi:hypothetical protein
MTAAPLPRLGPRGSSRPAPWREGAPSSFLARPVPVPPNVPQPTGNHGNQRGAGHSPNRLSTSGKGVWQGPQIGRRYVFQTDCAGSIPVARSTSQASRHEACSIFRSSPLYLQRVPELDKAGGGAKLCVLTNHRAQDSGSSVV